MTLDELRKSIKHHRATTGFYKIPIELQKLDVLLDIASAADGGLTCDSLFRETEDCGECASCKTKQALDKLKEL